MPGCRKAGRGLVQGTVHAKTRSTHSFFPVVIPKGHDFNRSNANIHSNTHQFWAMEGTSTPSLSRFWEQEISLAGFQRTGSSTALGLGVGSRGGPWPAEDSSPVVCSAGGTGLRKSVCCLTLHDQLLLVGSSLLLSPGMHTWAGAAGWALPQLSASDFPFPSLPSLRASSVSSPLTSDQASCAAENLEHSLLWCSTFGLCPTAALQIQKGLGLGHTHSVSCKPAMQHVNVIYVYYTCHYTSQSVSAAQRNFILCVTSLHVIGSPTQRHGLCQPMVRVKTSLSCCESILRPIPYPLA